MVTQGRVPLLQSPAWSWCGLPRMWPGGLRCHPKAGQELAVLVGGGAGQTLGPERCVQLELWEPGASAVVPSGPETSRKPREPGSAVRCDEAGPAKMPSAASCLEQPRPMRDLTSYGCREGFPSDRPFAESHTKGENKLRWENGADWLPHWRLVLLPGHRGHFNREELDHSDLRVGCLNRRFLNAKCKAVPHLPVRPSQTQPPSPHSAPQHPAPHLKAVWTLPAPKCGVL